MDELFTNEQLYYLLWEGVAPIIFIILGVFVVIVLIVVIGQIIKARVSSVGKRSFEKLANELKEENTKMTAELADIKENLSSINKMMQEIQ